MEQHFEFNGRRCEVLVVAKASKYSVYRIKVLPANKFVEDIGDLFGGLLCLVSCLLLVCLIRFDL